MITLPSSFFFFFFNDTATTEIYTSFPTRRSSDLWRRRTRVQRMQPLDSRFHACTLRKRSTQELNQPCNHSSDRKSTRLNSSHLVISYAVFCLKKKKKKINLNF